jgi:hypothetical protein
MPTIIPPDSRSNEPVSTTFKYCACALVAALVAIACLRYGKEIIAGGSAWKTGDWLINYEGGWVRRGFIGQVLFELSRFGAPLLWSTFILQCTTFVALTFYVLKLFFWTNKNSTWLIFLLSPAFIFLFPFYDTEAGFRKEILVYLSFCLLATGLLKDGNRQKYLIGSVLIYAVAAISHELSAFCVVFFLYLLKQHSKENRLISIRYGIAYIVLALFGLGFASLNPGNADVQSKVCKSLIDSHLKGHICYGGIAWLQFNSSYGFSKVSETAWSAVSFYLPRLMLALAPFMLTGFLRKNRLIFAVGFIVFLPLFFVAIDWGRWIHLYIFFMTIILFVEAIRSHVVIRQVPTAFVLVYACIWSIPHVYGKQPGWGMLEQLRRFI